ncbi:type I-E CRISPR-associated endoribonuclease Cas2e [Pseudonocardia sp. EV170527-09]|uniref:type I-E CRISPR-associated endoribonuclease Cas2e n=1 Tax=Pseudonocardia sp. EV170527-09 TaxID=2603411 RepID=UPI001F0140BC|nr:type I-E CRISPR-associated endoribonuclease Cas2e [Pseudonocardia sp. EV170527-09]
MDAPARLPVFRATTAQVGGLFPLLAAGGVPAVGARMGYDASSGSAFYAHPAEWVAPGDGRAKLVTNPNMMFYGEPGRGKSSTVLAFCLRMMPFGFKTLISGDRKGEYTPVLRALGIEPIVLGAGSPRRLNALDLGPLRVRWDTWSHDRQRRELEVVLVRWNRLLLALSADQGYAPTVTDEYVLHTVLRWLIGADDTTTGLRPVTIPQVTRLLADPDDALWLLEISAGVFVGKVTTRVRELLWLRTVDMVKTGRAIMVFSADNEQGLDFRTHKHDWIPTEIEGITLMLRPNPENEQRRPTGDPDRSTGWSSASRRRRFRGR